jgi:DNA-binding HxlR family transcriptional regulator
MIISGAAGFLISAIAAEVYSTYTEDDLIDSVATVLTGFAVSSVVFAILFHMDNKYMYIDKSTGKIDFKNLKQVLKKLMAAGLVFEIVNNSSRFIILYQLFTMDVDPSDASMLSSLAAYQQPDYSIFKNGNYPASDHAGLGGGQELSWYSGD